MNLKVLECIFLVGSILSCYNSKASQDRGLCWRSSHRLTSYTFASLALLFQLRALQVDFLLCLGAVKSSRTSHVATPQNLMVILRLRYEGEACAPGRCELVERQGSLVY